jgi:imidazoleglycerol phosphate dehydratase HisB
LVIPAQRIGNFDTELVEHIFSSFAAPMNVKSAKLASRKKKVDAMFFIAF